MVFEEPLKLLCEAFVDWSWELGLTTLSSYCYLRAPGSTTSKYVYFDFDQ